MIGAEETISLLHSLYPFDYIRRQRPKRLVGFIMHAHKKQDKDQAWQMWLSKYPQMTKESFMSFNDFYKKMTAPVKTVKKGGLPPVKLYENMKAKAQKKAG